MNFIHKPVSADTKKNNLSKSAFINGFLFLDLKKTFSRSNRQYATVKRK